MSSPILRGGNLIVTAEGIRDTVAPGHAAGVELLLLLHAVRERGQWRGRLRRPSSLRADEVAGLPEMDRYLLAHRRLVERVGDMRSTSSRFLTRAMRQVTSSTCSPTGTSATPVTASGRRTRTRSDTLYTVLEVFMRVLAPLAPMESESVWRGLTGGESVHLADWPYVSDEKTGEATELGRVLVDDPALVDAMEKVRGDRLRHSVVAQGRPDPRAPAARQAHRRGRGCGRRQGVRRRSEPELDIKGY